MVMFKKIKSFEVVFNDPEKVYGSGEKVAGRVIVEVCEVTRIKAVRILACGVAKVLWMQGSQQCKQTLDYLRYEDTLLLEDQPTGTDQLCFAGRMVAGAGEGFKRRHWRLHQVFGVVRSKGLNYVGPDIFKF